MPKNWEAREKKLDKRKHGMVVTNRSMKTVILPMLGKRAEQAKKGKTK
jgi:hypothetical protein